VSRVRILFDERGEVVRYDLRPPDRVLFVIADLATALLEDLDLVCYPPCAVPGAQVMTFRAPELVGGTSEPDGVTCSLCGRRLTRQGFCPNPPSCNYQARLRLGIPTWQAKRFYADEVRSKERTS
jgi:hypothetical protein